MFKAGDIITPVDNKYITRHWERMEILEYDAILKEATVKDLDGDIIYNFNLNPNFGTQFKVIS